MDIRIKIEILTQPERFDLLNYTVSAVDLSYSNNQIKLFIPGVSLQPIGVQIGSNLQGTILALFNNLVQNATDLQSYFTLINGVIYQNFPETTPLQLTYTPHPWLFISLETIYPPIPEPIPAIELSSFQIEIIDTYENERILIEELTSINSPKLIYDGGDDIFEPFMNSTLEFNMLDLDALDARFYHLFTGDENRFLVKLSNIVDEENVQLVWQGFLLPDQYSEPYKNGIVPVNFTAIDMISTLKGKYLDPWIYYQKFTLPELFSKIMKLTGLNQDFIVKPSIINISNEVQWKNIIINLEPYVNDSKYDDVYKILEDVLISQFMTLKSYRGYWWLEGITRKQETSGPAFRFSSDNTDYFNSEISRSVISPMNSEKSMRFTSITPFKAVDIRFAIDQQISLYPEDIIIRDSEFLAYENDSYVETTPAATNFKQWIKVGAPELYFINPAREFSFSIYPGNSQQYANSMASSYLNYFQAPVKPFLKAGVNYEFEFEVDLKIYHREPYSSNVFREHLEAGNWDFVVMWQMLLNGSEIRSNAFQGSSLGLNKWDERNYKSHKTPDYSSVGFVYIISFLVTMKIKREFSVGQDGYLDFRILKPFFVPGSLGVGVVDVNPKIFTIKVLDGKDNENIRAVRDVNFTQVKSVDLPVTTSINASIPNSYSIGSRIGDQEMTIPVLGDQFQTFSQVFPPLNNLVMSTRKFTISSLVAGLLFDQNKRKSLYLEKANGDKKHFFSIYARKESGVVKLYYLINWTGRPFKPKDYVKLPVIQFQDQLKLKLSNFTTENYSYREKWHIYGFPQWIENYPKTIANAYHSVRKEPSFGLETTLLFLMLPDQLFNFYFAGQSRNFIPTRLELDLTSGKTTANLKEATLNQITDITYE